MSCQNHIDEQPKTAERSSLEKSNPAPRGVWVSLLVSKRRRGAPKKLFRGKQNTETAPCPVEEASPPFALPPKGTSRKQGKTRRSESPPIPIEKLRFLTVAQASLRYPAFSEKSFRHLIAQSEAYQRHPRSSLKSNGFVNCIVRPAGMRKILIDADAFENWLQSFAAANQS